MWLALLYNARQPRRQHRLVGTGDEVGGVDVDADEVVRACRLAIHVLSAVLQVLFEHHG